MQELIEGAAILLTGIGIGTITGRRRHPKPPKPLEAICGCTHHLSLHDPKSDRCHSVIEVPNYVDQTGATRNWKFEPCPCRQYVGPRPAESFLAEQFAFGATLRVLPPPGPAVTAAAQDDGAVGRP